MQEKNENFFKNFVIASNYMRLLTSFGMTTVVIPSVARNLK